MIFSCISSMWWMDGWRWWGAVRRIAATSGSIYITFDPANLWEDLSICAMSLLMHHGNPFFLSIDRSIDPLHCEGNSLLGIHSNLTIDFWSLIPSCRASSWIWVTNIQVRIDPHRHELLNRIVMTMVSRKPTPNCFCLLLCCPANPR
jgi:hypothetical protein